MVIIKKYYCIKNLDTYFQKGNSYELGFDRRRFYPYHDELYDYPVDASEINGFFITLEEWRDIQIKKILKNE